MINIRDNVTIGNNVVMNKKNKSDRVGFTCGSFDLIHPGHILMLEEAKAQCDYLIVGVQSDPTIDRAYKNKPIQSYDERIIMVKSIKWVDDIVCYDTEDDLLQLLADIKPDVRIVGSDWKGKKFTGHELDIDVYFNSRDHSWSTSNLRRRIFNSEKNKIAESIKPTIMVHPLNDCPVSGF